MSKLRTDGDIVRLARQWHGLQNQILALSDAVRKSEHPNAAALAEALAEQCISWAWPEHVISPELEHPEDWEAGEWGIRHIAATRAVDTRQGMGTASGQ